MSANVPVYVKVHKIYEDIIETSAVTLEDAIKKVNSFPEVVHIIAAAYDREEME